MLTLVGLSHCTVSDTDAEGMTDAVDVQAESLFEAACLALHAARSSPHAGVLGPVTALEIRVRQPETRHQDASVNNEAVLAGKIPKLC